jgi:hypothetical protein
MFVDFGQWMWIVCFVSIMEFISRPEHQRLKVVEIVRFNVFAFNKESIMCFAECAEFLLLNSNLMKCGMW